MLDSLKEFPELPLEIEVNDQNWEIRINWKSGKLSIPGASAVSSSATAALSTIIASAQLSDAPTARSSKRLPVKAKGEVRLRSV